MNEDDKSEMYPDLRDSSDDGGDAKGVPESDSEIDEEDQDMKEPAEEFDFRALMHMFVFSKIERPIDDIPRAAEEFELIEDDPSAEVGE